MADSFTLPNQQSSAQERPTGQGDNGETWDPVQKRWVPKGQMPAQPTNGPVTGFGGPEVNASKPYRPADPVGFSQREFYLGGQHRTGQGEGKQRREGAWGGYDATWEIGPDGVSRPNYGRGGADDDVNRFRDMAYGQQQKPGYQNDYSAADAFAGMGAESRAGQIDAMARARNVALNGDATSQKLGRDMLVQGNNAQIAGALSTRGGALGGVSALQTQQQNVGSYLQKGTNALEAQKAADMAAGRDEYMAAASGIRQGDMAAQGLNQRQAIEQGKNEIDQRQLNDQTEGGYEDLAYGTRAAEQEAALKRQQIGSSIFTNELQADASQDARNARNITGALDSTSKAASNAWGDDKKTSDRRAKRPASMADYVGGGK